MTLVQRWIEGRERWRPAYEPIDTRRYDIERVYSDRVVGEFVRRHHYLRSLPAVKYSYGLYERHKLVGVAVFDNGGANERTLGRVFPEPDRAVHLGRFLLLDSVAGNGESWFIARCFELLRGEGVSGVLSFSDPVERRDAKGRPVKPGHLGIIYQATNALYLGRATPRTLKVFSDGSVFNERTIQKIRARERGWRGAVRKLTARGVRPPEGEDLRGWLRLALAEATTDLRHPGNHRYCWALDRRWRRFLPAGMPYPKWS